MMAGSHIVLGLAAWVVAAPYLGMPAFAPIPLSLAVLGSLLPDIDHPKSLIGRRSRPVSTLICKAFGHRGITHSLAAVAVGGALLQSAGMAVGIVLPLVIGYLSHLFADMLTPSGLRFAWPLAGRWSLPICRTGSRGEILVVAILLSAAVLSSLDHRLLYSTLHRLLWKGRVM